MLSSMRSGKYRYFFYALLALLAIGLIGFGSGGMGGGDIKSIGTVGKQNISIDSYANRLSSSMQNITAQFGRKLTASEIEAFKIKQNVLKSLLSEATLDNEAKSLGISIGDRNVAKTIQESAAFQGLDANFDQEKYNSFLRNRRLSAAEYEKSIRDALSRRLIEPAIYTGIKGGASQANAFVSFYNETRDFDWVILSSKTSIPEPKQQQLQEFYDANNTSYMSEKKREISYAWITPEMLSDEIKVDQGEIKTAFEANKSHYSHPEMRTVDRIIFGDQAQADDAKKRLDNNTISFSDLAIERGLTPEDINLGEITKNTLSAPETSLLFKKDKPGIYGPAQSDLGPALFRITNIIKEEIVVLKDIEKDLRAEITNDKARKIIADMVTDVDDQLAAGVSLEELAQSSALSFKKISFTKESNAKIATYSKFKTAAENVTIDDNPKIIDLPDGGIFTLRLDKITEPELKPFNTIQNLLKTDWIKQENLRLLKLKADKIISKIHTGSNLTLLEKTTVNQVGATRTTQLENLPFSLISEVFKLDINKANSIEFDNKIYIAQVKKINISNPSDPKNIAFSKEITAQLEAEISNEILNLFIQARQENEGVHLNQTVINSINSQLLSEF